MSSESVNSLLGTARDALILRVCGPRHDGVRVEIQTQKCLVGRDESCDVHLDYDDVDDIVCLILRGKLGTVIRGCSRDLRINGRSVHEAFLHPGDRIATGSVAIEIVKLACPLAVDNEVGRQATTVSSTPTDMREVGDPLEELNATAAKPPTPGGTRKPGRDIRQAAPLATPCEAATLRKPPTGVLADDLSAEEIRSLEAYICKLLAGFCNG